MKTQKQLLRALKREMNTKRNFLIGYKSVVSSMKQEIKSLKRLIKTK